MTDRRTIREIVLQALYASEVSRDKLQHILENIVYPQLDGEESVVDFAEKLFLKTNENSKELDEVIQDHIKNWRIERLAIIDKLILRMALCEFLHFEKIPTKVSINEAIELAKKYSTKKSGEFVNGILDAALKDLNEDDRIEKKGRGLIETSYKSE